MAEELDTACLWSRDAFTDLEIRLSDSPRTKPLKAHKAILYSRSSKFREILEKNKTATEVSIGIQDLNDNVWYHQVTKMDVTELLEAVYTGTFAAEERDGFPLAYEILRAYGFGHVTGTPLLQEAAARRFKNAISTFEECYRSRQIPDNFTFLLHAAQLLYIEPGLAQEAFGKAPGFCRNSWSLNRSQSRKSEHRLEVKPNLDHGSHALDYLWRKSGQSLEDGFAGLVPANGAMERFAVEASGNEKILNGRDAARDMDA
ncbi:hypothetical protein BC567DRAFT_249738 [Phyllosticta citribraziliensis]